jgi:hypothetical protein
MSATVTQAGPYYSSGSISFSSLRANFRAQQSPGSFSSDTLPIKVSELRRVTNTSNSSPIVPDAVENANISTSLNLKLSQFRNSIKYYYVTQSGTNDNSSSLSSPGFDIGSQSWNSNLNKNIQKYVYLNGIIGSTIITQYAAYLQAETYNLQIVVEGKIYGAGGSSNGGNGGPALYVNSSGSSVTINVQSTANIYSGGGGGEKGKTGNTGAPGTCYNSTDYTTGSACGSVPSCNSGDTQLSYSGAGGCNCGKGGCSSTAYYSTCRNFTPYTVPGAPGGEGGNGGVGQGYNQSKTNGSLGTPGTTGGCPTYGGSGEVGETGGTGGDWGSSGANTENTGSGGSSGRAITGSNYSVTGTINSATIKGAYQL